MNQKLTSKHKSVIYLWNLPQCYFYGMFLQLHKTYMKQKAHSVVLRNLIVIQEQKCRK